jgi:hypothetical protein
MATHFKKFIYRIQSCSDKPKRSFQELLLDACIIANAGEKIAMSCTGYTPDSSNTLSPGSKKLRNVHSVKVPQL